MSAVAQYTPLTAEGEKRPERRVVETSAWQQESYGPHGWLLRLFQSDFFNTWIGVSYLFKYPHNIGIQHYLCDELKKFPLAEIEFHLPQLCHLLVFHPSDVVALENFLIDRSLRSSHIAILLSWYLEAYLRDLLSQPKSRAFLTCRRVHKKCRRILTAELNSNNTTATATSNFGGLSPDAADAVEEKIKPFIAPTLVGMGASMASLASPLMSKHIGAVALAQGKRELPVVSHGIGFFHRAQSTPLLDTIVTSPGVSPTFLLSPTSPVGKTSILSGLNFASAIKRRFSIHSPTLEDLHHGEAFSFDRFLARTDKTATQSHNQFGRGRAQTDGKKPDETKTLLGPSFTDGPETKSSASRLSRMPSGSIADGHYFHSELQFLHALIEISIRLVPVNRPARLSSLRAELALINHNLPANVCFPLWCPAGNHKKFHHQVVRIPPEESVVLNSADRVPYLILVEVIETDQSVEELKSFVESSAAQASTIAALQQKQTAHSSFDINANGGGYGSNISQQTTLSTGQLVDISLENNDGFMSTELAPANGHVPEAKEKRTLTDHKMLSAKDSPSVGNLLSARSVQDEFSDRMRTAAIMLAQLNSPKAQISAAMQRQIREKILKEMVALEEKRVLLANNETEPSSSNTAPVDYERDPDDKVSATLHLMKDDPSASVFRERYEDKVARIRRNSPYGSHENWKLISVIVKSGADLRQEQLALQLIREMEAVWKQENIPVWVYYYRIMVVSDSSGIMETITNSISVHSLKKEAMSRQVHKSPFTLHHYFLREFGSVGSEQYRKAQDCFMRSLVAYSVITYVLALKDRHNGNILIDNEGHLIHIDFGFMLSNSPGAVGFEMAPFKMTQEYLDILGGLKSQLMDEFKVLLVKSFMALRKHADKFILLVEMMTKDSKFPCFSGNPEAAVNALRERFQLPLTEKQIEAFFEQLVTSSCNNVFTRLYDNFQYYSNGIL